MGITLADTGLTYFGIVGGAAAVAGVAAIDVAAGRLNVSNAFLLMLLGTECFRSFSILGGYWHTGYRGIAAINDLSAILEIQNPAPIERPSAALSSTSAISRHEDTGCSAVAFDHVAFAYPGAAGPVVRDVTFAVQPGERFAIVGPSGAGKSTLIGLLLRLLEPQGGAVSVFGARAQERPLNDHRAFFGIVWQETYLFRSSIAENIRLGRPRATDAEVETAARAARVDEFVQRLPAKYNTLVGERGLTLSGGERQRIALARALLLDAPILVFDEATSNVDALSEALIFEALRELDRTRTVITIAHRFSTIRNAERVLVIEAGRVIEQGTHAELLVRGNAYAGIIAEQCEPA
jgi:ATP-binding cassette subfamily C protein CydD